MAKADWGLKRICPHCGTRYYDMKKKTPQCPKCGTIFDPEALVRARRGRAVPEDKTSRKAVPEVLDDVPLMDDEDPAVIEDADELGEDVDVDDVVEVEEDERDN